MSRAMMRPIEGKNIDVYDYHHSIHKDGEQIGKLHFDRSNLAWKASHTDGTNFEVPTAKGGSHVRMLREVERHHNSLPPDWKSRMNTAAESAGTKTLNRNANRAKQHVFTPGRKVNALYDEDGEHYPATYVKRNADGTHRVKWEDGGEHADVTSVLPHWKSEASAEPIERGTEVSAIYDDGQWYPAVYVAERASGDHRVRWADGSGVDEVAAVEVSTKETESQKKALAVCKVHSKACLQHMKHAYDNRSDEEGAVHADLVNYHAAKVQSASKRLAPHIQESVDLAKAVDHHGWGIAKNETAPLKDHFAIARARDGYIARKGDA